MIIAINGDLIDVSKIYQINDIYSDSYNHIFHHFEIKFLGKKESLTISIDSKCYKSGNYVSIEGIEQNMISIEPNKDKVLEYIKQQKVYKETLNKLKEVRDVLIAYWSNNQSTIPQINF